MQWERLRLIFYNFSIQSGQMGRGREEEEERKDWEFKWDAWGKSWEKKRSIGKLLKVKKSLGENFFARNLENCDLKNITEIFILKFNGNFYFKI